VIADYVTDVLGRHRRLVARFAATAVGRSAASMAVILLIRDFVAGALGEGAGACAWAAPYLGRLGTLAAVAGAVLAAYAAASVLNFLNLVTQQRLIKALEVSVTGRLVRRLLWLPPASFQRLSQGDVIDAMRQDVVNLSVVVRCLANLALEGTLAVGLVVAAVWLSPWLALWVLALLGAAACPILLIAQRIRRRSYRVRKTGYLLFDLLLQIVAGIQVIRVYRGEERQAQICVENSSAYFDELTEMVRVQGLAQVVLDLLAGIGVVAVIVVGGAQVVSGALTWPALLAFVMAVRTLQGPVGSMHAYYALLQSTHASVSRVRSLLEAPDSAADRPDAVPVPARPQTISFDRVSVAFDGAAVLRDVGFSVHAGEKIGIVGPSGVGKTTLLRLLLRFEEPSEGRVLVDGRELRDYQLSTLYDRLALVTQEPFLFATSVRENIRLGRPGASAAEVEAAARAAAVHDEIERLPQGYETRVGTGGRPLSRGQAQRVNIARALLKDAPILLLDEATSSLDSIAETAVREATDRLTAGRTCFIVAHRLATLREADRILVLERGRCAGFDHHRALLQNCPVYRRMYELQLLTESPPQARSA
jgi:ATP-binding cassette subfamily B protein